MKKLITQILILTTLLTSFVFSPTPIKTAEAALSPGAKVNYRIYHSQLRNYLLNYSAVSGRNCNVTPRPSFCLSLKSINDIMAWVRDPNNDGDKSDGILMAADSTYRKYAMQNAARKGFHPWIMANIVIKWEVRTHYIINPPDLTPDNAVSFSDTYWTNLVLNASDMFTEFRGLGGDYVTGDALVRDLAYWKQPGAELAPGVPKLVLKPKSKVSSAARNRLYGVRKSDGTWKGGVKRMIPYRDFKDDNAWVPGEVVEMDKAISFQNSVEKEMAELLKPSSEGGSGWNASASDRYKAAKMLVGLWDGVLVAANVVPLLKVGHVVGMAKFGAKEANAVSKVAKITVNGQKVAAPTSLIAEVSSESAALSIQEVEKSVSTFDDLFDWLFNRTHQYHKRPVAALWSRVKVVAKEEGTRGAAGFHFDAQGWPNYSLPENIFKIENSSATLSNKAKGIILHEQIHDLFCWVKNQNDSPWEFFKEILTSQISDDFSKELGFVYSDSYARDVLKTILEAASAKKGPNGRRMMNLGFDSAEYRKKYAKLIEANFTTDGNVYETLESITAPNFWPDFRQAYQGYVSAYDIVIDLNRTPAKTIAEAENFLRLSHETDLQKAALKEWIVRRLAPN